jgi:DNA mismatch repair protein MutS2
VESGGTAAPGDFRRALAAGRAVESVRRALAKAAGPRLSARREALPSMQDLLDSAQRLFAHDGTVRDDASPALAAARSKLRRRRDEVSRTLERMLDARREWVSDAVVVLRNDRYCLPVVSSARSRVSGIVHDRSGSGQTVFVEPIEVIEANNELALLASEERLEVERLLTEFGRALLDASDRLEDAVAALAELDALEARVEFGEISKGRVPEISDDGGWALAAARHPLLDPLLAPLRRRVLEEDRAERPVVPLDLTLPPDRHLLVISGPNAGGKTVVVKTAGLFSLMAQAGIPVPAAAGTRLPVFQSISTEIGDAQAILSDKSTFSSSMETLKSMLDLSQPGALAIVDEIGGATDPEEGSAIAIAWLEEYLARGGRAVVTTHFSGIKAFAESRPDAVLAAMEFDEATGRPTYRLHPGLSGRSRALSVARERGLPESVLARALDVLGEAWRRREERETEAEAALERLRAAQKEAAEQAENAGREAERAAAEREALAAERRRLRREGLEGFERARRDLARQVEERLAELKQSARAPGISAGRLLDEAEASLPPPEALEEARRDALERAAELAAGSPARVRGARTAGILAAIEGDSGWLEAGGKRMRFPLSQLEPAGAAPPPRPTGRRAAAPGNVPSRPEPMAALTREVNVIGQTVEDAIPEIEKRLDEAMLAGAGRLRVVHGHGTGRLRESVREHFRKYPGVSSLHAADAREGGNGATILELL